MFLRWSLRLFSLLVFLSLPAFAAKSYDAIYVFGDSYCDVGNIYIATAGAIPASPPYYYGRFSNGPIWVEHVAGSLGLPMKPSLALGTDYAFGDAEVTQSVSFPQGTIPSVPEQVGLYLKQHGGHADPDALYIIEGGGNDILHASGGNPEYLGYKIAAGLAGSELLLRQAGAKHFLIPNLIDIAQLPAGKARADFNTDATVATNAALEKLLRFEEDLEDVHIDKVDVFTIFHAIARDPTHFGFKNITTPCLNPVTNAVCADPDHTLFWDVEHPTEFGHSFFAVLADAKILH